MMAAMLPSWPDVPGHVRWVGSGFGAWLRDASRHAGDGGAAVVRRAGDLLCRRAQRHAQRRRATQVVALALWWLLYGLLFGALLLLCGHLLQRLPPRAGRGTRLGVALLAVPLRRRRRRWLTGGRADILVEQGVVENATTMHLLRVHAVVHAGPAVPSAPAAQRVRTKQAAARLAHAQAGAARGAAAPAAAGAAAGGAGAHRPAAVVRDARRGAPALRCAMRRAPNGCSTN